MALSDWDKKHLSSGQQRAVLAYTEQWERANRLGDTAGMERAHASAEAIRRQAGYSGGNEGGAFIAPSSQSTVSSKSYDNGTLTHEQVKTLQGALGVDQDGYFGAKTQAAAFQRWGASNANEAMKSYQSTAAAPRTSFDFDEDEGTYHWNGQTFATKAALTEALNRANLTAAEKSIVERKAQNSGAGVKLSGGTFASTTPAQLGTETSAAANSQLRSGKTPDEPRYLAAPDLRSSAAYAKGLLDQAVEKKKQEEKRAAELPTLGERIGKTVLGGAQNYAAGMANAGAVLAQLGNGGVAIPAGSSPAIRNALTAQGRAVGDAQSKILYGAADTFSQRAAENSERAKEGASEAGKVALDVIGQGTQMLGDAAIGIATGGSALIPMAARSFGSGAQEARANGADATHAALYGAGNAAVEVLSEKFFDGLAGIYGKGFANGVVNRVLSKLDKVPAVRTALSIAANAGGEAFEEFLSGVAQPALQAIYNGKSLGQNYSELEASDILYDMLIGGIMGGLGGTVDTVRTAAAPGVTQQNSEAPRYIPTAEEVVAQKNAASGETAGNKGESAAIVSMLQKSIPEIQGNNPVAAVSTQSVVEAEGKTFREKVANLFGKIAGIVQRPGFGDIEINTRSAKDDIGHGMGATKAVTIQAVPNVLREGKEINNQVPYGDKNENRYTFAAPVLMDGNPVYVAAVVKQTSKNRFYLHEVVDSKGNIIKMNIDLDNGESANQTSPVAASDAGTQSPLPNSDTTIPQQSNPVKYLPTVEEYVEELRARGPQARRSEAPRYIPTAEEAADELRARSTQGPRVETPKQTSVSVTGQNADSAGPLQSKMAESGSYAADMLPRSTRRFYQDAERGLVRSLGEVLSVPEQAQSEVLEGIARRLTEEYARSGGVSQETVDELFDNAWVQGLVVDSAFYDQYKDLKKRLRETPVTISESDASSIADFADWKRNNRNAVRVVREGGTPVDVFYSELADAAPELFPADITHPSAQLERIAEVAKSIEKAKYTMDRYYGSEAAGFYADTKRNFEQAVNDLYGEARQEPAENKGPVTPQELDEYWNMVEGMANPVGPRTVPEELVSAKTEKQTKSARERASEAWSYFKRKMLDSGEAVTRIGKAVNDPVLYPYYNMARASTNAATSMITEGAADVRGRRTGKSLNEVFSDVRAKGNDYYNDFQLYLLHLHNVDRMSRENAGTVDAARAAFEMVQREYPELNRFADYQIERMAQQEGSPYYFEAGEYVEAMKKLRRAEAIQNKPVFGYDVDAEQSRAAAAELARQFPEFVDKAQEVYDYIDNLMRYRVDSGLITEEDYRHLKEIYPHYVPTYRTFERKSGTRNRKSVKVGSTIGQAVGGTEKIMPLHEALAKQTMSVVREGSKNRFGQRLMNSGAEKTAREHVQHVEQYEDGTNEDTFDELSSSNDLFKKDNTFVVRENGKMYEMTVSPALFEAVKALSPDSVESNAFTRVVRKGNDLFKRLVTGDNPTFLVRNFMRDLQDAGLYSKDLSEFAKNYPQALAEIATDGEYWQMYKALGGTYSSIFDYETGNVKEQSKLREKTLGRVEALNEAVEQAPRLAEFMATVKKNGGLDADMDTLMQGMYNAADVTVNFGRSGTLGKQLNANYIPFLNPGIQGFDKMVRTFTETKGAKDWARLAVKCAVLGVAPRIINELLYKDDDEWDELKDRDKDTYYLFKLKDGTWLKLPKGRNLSVIGAAADRIGDAARGENVDWGELAGFALDQTAPANPLQENILRAWFDADLRNPDSAGRTWYGSDIESQRLSNYAPGERYDARTDELSKWLGGKLNLSPKKINYLLDQYSGVVGDVLLPMMTPTAERDMFSAAFTIDSAMSNRLSNDFYTTKDDLTYAKNGPNATDADQVVYRWFNKQNSAVSEVNAAIREIEGDTTISDADKKELLRAQYRIRNAVERSALDTLDTYAEAAQKWSRSGDAEYAYRMANKEVFGAEYALQTYDKDVYAKAAEANKQGVSFDTYFDYYFAQKELTSDKDADGKTISGSKKRKVMEAIDALPISDAQKDVLYLQQYTESTIDEAPWHSGALAAPGQSFLERMVQGGAVAMPALPLAAPGLNSDTAGTTPTRGMAENFPAGVLPLAAPGLDGTTAGTTREWNHPDDTGPAFLVLDLENGTGRKTNITGVGKPVTRGGKINGGPVGQNWHWENGKRVPDTVLQNPGHISSNQLDELVEELARRYYVKSLFPTYDQNAPGISHGLMPLMDQALPLAAP